ncbi:uncharacterized protein LOC109118371 [Fukomys damarensis]|uniref:uncharacterized protein LOC109118371 n=1 Tax=Fukomys damarensis TaxID=885580 RepID=UPI0008FF34B9|nr:uncharacterized protein LOC109118371 [Fukomys damarensis]
MRSLCDAGGSLGRRGGDAGTRTQASRTCHVEVWLLRSPGCWCPGGAEGGSGAHHFWLCGYTLRQGTLEVELAVGPGGGGRAGALGSLEAVGGGAWPREPTLPTPSQALQARELGRWGGSGRTQVSRSWAEMSRVQALSTATPGALARPPFDVLSGVACRSRWPTLQKRNTLWARRGPELGQNPSAPSLCLGVLTSSAPRDATILAPAGGAAPGPERPCLAAW